MTLRTQIGRYIRRNDGAAAMELALLAPFLFVLMLGSFSLFDQMRASGKVYSAAQSASDLVTRIEEADADKLTAINSAAIAILGRYGNGARVEFGVSSVVNPLGDDSDDLEVVWTNGPSDTVKLTDDELGDLSLPAIPDGESVMIVISSVDFQPALRLNGWKFGTMGQMKTFEETVIRRPRFVTEVCFVENDDSRTCGNPTEEEGGVDTDPNDNDDDDDEVA